MTPLRIHQLALTFAGCFLGAGFVSGQELWQFFGCFGPGGLVGLVGALATLTLFGILLLWVAAKTGIAQQDRILIPWEKPRLRGLTAGLQCLFLFGIVLIMLAGGGALLEQLFGLPKWWGNLMMGLLVLLVSLGGLSGLVSAFSVSVPLIVVATVVFSVAALVRFGGQGLTFPAVGSDNPLLPGWPVAMLTFSAYNIFGTFGILTPFGSRVPSTRRLIAGVSVGGLLLLVIAGSILLAMALCPEAAGAEIPMLEIACRLSPALGTVYGLLLLAGIFGTALSCFVALLTWLELRWPALQSRRRCSVCLLGVPAYVLSLLGFGDLVGTVYPVFGYLSVFALGALVLHFRLVRKRQSELLQ